MGGGVKNILDIENCLDLLGIFQTFYHNTGRLPMTNGLLIVPDGEALQREDKVNMKNLYEMFQHIKSHGLVSLLFLGVLHYYFNGKELHQIKNALTELCKNLSYTTGARKFEFGAVSELIGRVSFLIKGSTLMNIKNMEKEDQENAQKINKSVSFAPKIEDPLDDVIEILYDDIEHKTTTHPNAPLLAQTAPTAQLETRAVDN